MKKSHFAIAAWSALFLSASIGAARTPPPVKPPPEMPKVSAAAEVFPSPNEIVAAAPAGDWVAIAASDLLVMELAADAKGKARRVVIQLMPAPFSQGWVGNIRKLAAAHWWDGAAIVRVQDNYVTQWGDPDGEDPVKAKKLPDGLVSVPESEYQSTNPRQFPFRIITKRSAKKDMYSDVALPLLGWPLAFGKNAIWPVHCYGMVGVGRNMSPDTGTGAELYTVIGHAPRHLDRNIALVGRIIEGMEHMSSLPRGTGALGFYEKPEERTAIVSVRLMSEMGNDKPLPTYEYLSTESASFAKYADARANRRDPFFITPAGGADICNIPVPVRRKG
jgi:cyclophilin family peptidyl-prolyl cis-trans isomerase